jgi:hypothetical protein
MYPLTEETIKINQWNFRFLEGWMLCDEEQKYDKLERLQCSDDLARDGSRLVAGEEPGQTKV